jgi:FKBP-type peptidyl-prolyl cis-trans isomerase
MKSRKLTIGIVAVAIVFGACNKIPHTGSVKLKNQLDSLSYALGFFEAESWKKKFEQIPFDTIDYKQVALAFKNSKLLDNYIDFRKKQFDTIDIEMFQKGFFNEVAFNKSYFTDMTADVYIRKIFQNVKTRKDSLKRIQGKKNLEKGKVFLEENAKKEGVISLESGLQYKIIKEGNGPVPLASDLVKCTYHGTLIDGTVFNSSIEKGDTATFRVTGVIKGWKEALQLMPTGSKWQLYVPDSLAYGSKGAGDNIGPNETLIFDIELIDIVQKDQKK